MLTLKKQIRLLVSVELMISLVYLSFVYLLRLGDLFSALTGCLASLIPGFYFAIKIWRQADNNDPQSWISHAYRADFGKWLMTGVIFFLAFTSGYIWDPLIFFVGYLLVQMSGMFVPFFTKGY